MASFPELMGGAAQPATWGQVDYIGPFPFWEEQQSVLIETDKFSECKSILNSSISLILDWQNDAFSAMVPHTICQC